MTGAARPFSLARTWKPDSCDQNLAAVVEQCTMRSADVIALGWELTGCLRMVELLEATQTRSMKEE